VDAYADELAGLRGVFGRSQRGDVIGVTALGMRNEVFGWLEAAGAKRLTPADVKRLVKRAVS
jgi:CRP-like cAMP-binding protein